MVFHKGLFLLIVLRGSHTVGSTNASARALEIAEAQRRQPAGAKQHGRVVLITPVPATTLLRLFVRVFLHFEGVLAGVR